MVGMDRSPGSPTDPGMTTMWSSDLECLKLIFKEIFKTSISKRGSAMSKLFLLAKTVPWILSKITEYIPTF